MGDNQRAELGENPRHRSIINLRGLSAESHRGSSVELLREQLNSREQTNLIEEVELLPQSTILHTEEAELLPELSLRHHSEEAELLHSIINPQGNQIEAQPGESAELLQQRNQRPIQNVTMVDTTIKAMDSLKSFRGTPQENSRDWLDRAEIVFNAYNINDADRLIRIAIKLEDAAFDWYRDTRGQYQSWNAFRQACEHTFPPPERTQNKHLLAEQINQRKQGANESVHDYFYSLDQLCRQYDPQMSLLDKTIRLVGGLRDELKEKVLPLNLRTPDEFLIQAKNYESSQQVMNQQRRTNEHVESLEPIYIYEHNQYPTTATMKQTHQQRFHFNHRQPPQFDQRQPAHFNHRQHPRVNFQHQPPPQQQQNVQQPVQRQEKIQPLQQQEEYDQWPINHPQRASNYQVHPDQQRTSNHQTPLNQVTRNDHRSSNGNPRLCYICRKPGHFARDCSHYLNELQEQ